MKSSNRANFVVLTYKMVLVILSIVLMTSSIIVLVSYSAFKEQFNSS
ncbi:stage II sporulation protein P, partial [Priestia megaterium]